jgi:hypothetical protein
MIFDFLKLSNKNGGISEDLFLKHNSFAYNLMAVR